MVKPVSVFFSCAIILVGSIVCQGQSLKSKSAKQSFPPPQKLSARQRLDRNKTIQKHITWEENGLLGKVKKVVAREYIKSEERKAPEVKSCEEMLFSPSGFLAETIVYSADGTPESTTITLYDGNMNDTSEYTYSLPGHSLMYRMLFKKDKRGNEIGVVSHNYGSEVNELHAKYKYDTADNLIEADLYADNGSLHTRTLFSYDEMGYKTGGVTYDSAGNFKGAYICKYADNGNFLSSKTTDASGKVTGLDSTFYYSTSVEKKNIKYWYKNGAPRNKLISKFDDHGKSTETLFCEPDGRMIESKSAFYENSYDATGNISHRKSYRIADRKKTMSGYTEYIYTYY